jgi:hypothetical protein
MQQFDVPITDSAKGNPLHKDEQRDQGWVAEFDS